MTGKLGTKSVIVEPDSVKINAPAMAHALKMEIANATLVWIHSWSIQVQIALCGHVLKTEPGPALSLTETTFILSRNAPIKDYVTVSVESVSVSRDMRG
jgi:hypothetical protein